MLRGVVECDLLTAREFVGSHLRPQPYVSCKERPPDAPLTLGVGHVARPGTSHMGGTQCFSVKGRYRDTAAVRRDPRRSPETGVPEDPRWTVSQRRVEGTR